MPRRVGGCPVMLRPRRLVLLAIGLVWAVAGPALAQAPAPAPERPPTRAPAPEKPPAKPTAKPPARDPLDYKAQIPKLEADLKRGDMNAAELLGEIYQAGLGVPRNPQRGCDLFER